MSRAGLDAGYPDGNDADEPGDGAIRIDTDVLRSFGLDREDEAEPKISRWVDCWRS